jgi:hypothetical protein
MINGIGVMGWGVGGIEAEAVMLGQPYYMSIPQVVGVKLTGSLERRGSPPPTWCSPSPKCCARECGGKIRGIFGPRHERTSPSPTAPPLPT